MKENIESSLAELLAKDPEPKQEVYPGMTVEEIKAVFFNADALREPPYRVFQLNWDGYRYYYRLDESGEPQFFPSVTTLLKQVMPTPPALLDWMIKNGESATAKRDLAAAYGTFMHIQFERLIINRRYDFDAVPAALLQYIEENNLPDTFYLENLTKARKDVLAFAQFVKDYNVKPLAVEIGLVHPDYHFAGCIDLPCVMTDPKSGKVFPAIVDFKSGRKGFYEEHELQLHLYRAMWNVNFPSMPVERLFNFAPKDWRTKPSYNLKDQTESPNAVKLPHLLALATIEDENRDNTVTIIRGVLDLDKGKISDNMKTLSLSELIKSKTKKEETPKQAANAPEPEEMKEPSKKGRKQAVQAAKEPDPVNSQSEPLTAAKSEIPEKLPWESERPDPADLEPAKPVKTENKEKQLIRAGGAPESDRLPWEKDIADGTGIDVEKTDDGVKVTARYFELAPEQAAKDNLLNAEIEL